jgi:outer membrane protein assembly factor BamB
VPSSPASATRSAEPASLWQSSKLDPVSGVTNVDGVAVLYTHRGRALWITALDPETGERLWSHEASASGTLPGIGLSVATVDDRVVYLQPTRYQMARLVVANGHTGEPLLRSDKALFLTMPGECRDQPHQVCANGATYHDEVLIDGDFRLDPRRQRLISLGGDTGSDFQDLGPDGLVRDEGGPPYDSISLLRHGNEKWTIRTEALLGAGYSSAYGWTFDHLEGARAFVGSVGRRPLGDTIQLKAAVTLSLAESDGHLLWQQKGLSAFCDPDLTGSDAESDPYLACEWRSGTLHLRGADRDPQAEGVRANLVRLDPATGKRTWTAPLGNVTRTVEQNQLGFVELVDVGHVLVRTSKGPALVDVSDGAVSRPARDTVVWQSADTTFHYEVAWDNGDDVVHERHGDDVWSPRHPDGDRAIVTDASGIPPAVGTTFDDADVRVVVGPQRVTAYPAS